MMMDVREYWDAQYFAAETDEEYDEVCELEEVMYRTLQEDEDDFTIWANEHNIDLRAVDDLTGEYVLTLWCWDMRGE